MKPDELINDCLDHIGEYAEMTNDPLERLLLASRYLASMHMEMTEYAAFLEKRVLQLKEQVYAFNRC